MPTKAQVIAQIMKYLAVPALALGLLSGGAILVRAAGVDDAVRISQWFFIALGVCSTTVLFLLPYRQRDYWREQLESKANEAVGQLLGIAIFGSLLAVTCFALLTVGLPYLVDAERFQGIDRKMTAVVSVPNMLILVSAACLAAGAAMARARKPS